MADHHHVPAAPLSAGPAPAGGFVPPVRTIDEARALARERFKERVANNEPVGNCDCHTGEAAAGIRPGDGPAARVTGVRFRDSGRTYYFDAAAQELDTGDWVVVETNRGQEAGRVVIAPHQVLLSTLEGDLQPVQRRLGEDEVHKMDRLRREAAVAVKTFGAAIRRRGLPMKAISADYTFDGSAVTLSFTSQDRPDTRELGRELAKTFGCTVEFKLVGPRDEARLLGGLGRCGRTLCCSSWLPVYPDISMGMAKTQDLALNPSKVSGVCGRLLCCLSYENEQYKQLKVVLPRLGQTIETPAGPGMVVSLQVLKELVTVRLVDEPQEIIFTSADLGLGAFSRPSVAPAARSEPVAAAPAAPSAAPVGPINVLGPAPAAAGPVEDLPVATVEEPAAAVEPADPADPTPDAVAGGAPEGTAKRRRRRRRRPAGGSA